MQEVNVPRVSLQGGAYVPPRAGALHPEGGPIGVFRYRDGEYVSMVLPHQWPQLVRALGRAELADDARFNTSICMARVSKLAYRAPVADLLMIKTSVV